MGVAIRIGGLAVGSSGSSWTQTNLVLEGHSFLAPLSPLSIEIVNKLNLSGFYNSAVPGAIMGDVEAREAVVDTKLVALNGFNKNILVLYIGINDMWGSGDGVKIANTIYSYALRRIAAGWKVFVYTTTVENAGYGFLESEVLLLNARLRVVFSGVNGAYLLDTDTIAALNDPNDTAYYNIDKLHPILLGGYLLSELFQTAILSISSKVMPVQVASPVANLNLTSTGDGSGVTIIEFKVSARIIVTVDGSAKFYKNASCTIGESNMFVLDAVGLIRSWIKCPVGTANLKISADNIYAFARLDSPANSPTLGGDMSVLTKMEIIDIWTKNTLSCDVSKLTVIQEILIYGTPSFDFTNVVLCKKLSSLHYNNVAISSAIVNIILAAFVANKDEIKPLALREIEINNGGSGAPTGQGITDKAALRAYRSPDNNAAYDLWTVSTR